jgi:hypothetical protein
MLIKFAEMLMRPRRLRKAIEAVVYENDHILRALAEYEKSGPTNLSWQEGGFWKGWNYNEEDGKYYFDDYGTDNFTDLMNGWDRLLNAIDHGEITKDNYKSLS